MSDAEVTAAHRAVVMVEPAATATTDCGSGSMAQRRQSKACKSAAALIAMACSGYMRTAASGWERTSTHLVTDGSS